MHSCSGAHAMTNLDRLRDVDVHHASAHPVAQHVLRLRRNVLALADLFTTAIQAMLVQIHPLGEAHVVLHRTAYIQHIEAQHRAWHRREANVDVNWEVMPSFKVNRHLHAILLRKARYHELESTSAHLAP